MADELVGGVARREFGRVRGEDLAVARAVGALRVETTDHRGVALPPGVHQRHEDLHAHVASPFEDRDAQLGEPVGDAAEEERLGQRAAGRGEVPDLVVEVIGDRLPVAEADARRMRGERHAELDGPGPERVVVVGAVEAERVDPTAREPRRDLEVVAAGALAQRPPDVAGHEADLGAQTLGVLEPGDRLFGGVGGDDRGHGEPVAVGAVLLGHELVVEPAQRDPRFVVGEPVDHQAHRGIEHREVDPRLAEPLVVARGQGHVGEVLGLGRRVPRRREQTEATLLLRRELGVAPLVVLPGEGRDLVDDRAGAVVAAEVGEHRPQLEHVPVAVEHRVAELLADVHRLRARHRHVRNPRAVQSEISRCRTSLLCPAKPVNPGCGRQPDASD